jgi:hypothetical protein
LLLLLHFLLIAPRLGSSYTYTTNGGKHYVHRSSSGAGHPLQTATHCSTVPYGNHMIPTYTRKYFSLFIAN